MGNPRPLTMAEVALYFPSLMPGIGEQRLALLRLLAARQARLQQLVDDIAAALGLAPV